MTSIHQFGDVYNDCVAITINDSKDSVYNKILNKCILTNRSNNIIFDIESIIKIKLGLAT